VAKPEFKATGYLQLIPSEQSADNADKAGRVRNPWNELGTGALAQAAEIQAQNQNTVKMLLATGFTDSYTISIADSSPVFTVESVAPTQAQAAATTNKVMDILTQAVQQQQANYHVAPEDSITTTKLNPELNIDTVTLKVKRALIIAFALGMLLTFAVTLGVDAWIRRRRRLNSEEVLPQPDPAPPMPRLAYENPPARPGSSYGGQYRSTTSAAEGLRPAISSGAGVPGSRPEPATNGDGRPSVFVDYQPASDGRPTVVTTPGRPPAPEQPTVASIDDPAARPDTTIVLPLSNAKWATKSDKGR
jgi:hypothetical protein